MPGKAALHDAKDRQRLLVDDLCVELVNLGADTPISTAELDALEQLLGPDLRQLLSN
jgi:hypothetical protein